MKTADLIDMLAQDAPVRWRLPCRLAMAFAVGALIAAAIFAAGVHLRPDLAAASQTPRVLFKFLFALTLLAGAAGAVTRAGRPDATPGPWAFVLAAVPLLLGAAIVMELLVTPASLWMTRLVGQNAVFCLTLVPVLALGPLACLFVALGGGAPAHPGLAGAVAGLAAGGIAVSLYALHCPDDSPLFVAVWYSSATALIAAAGYFAGERLLKW